MCGDLVGVLAPIRDEAYFLLATKREVNSIPFEILTERYTHKAREVFCKANREEGSLSP